MAIVYTLDCSSSKYRERCEKFLSKNILQTHLTVHRLSLCNQKFYQQIFLDDSTKSRQTEKRVIFLCNISMYVRFDTLLVAATLFFLRKLAFWLWLCARSSFLSVSASVGVCVLLPLSLSLSM